MSKDKEIKILNLEDALKRSLELSKASKRKFTESVDIAIVLGIDPKQSDQTVKGSLVLPHGSGKKVRVVVFTADEETKKIALGSGAVFAGLEDLVAKIEGGFLDFDCCVATPDVMPKISKIAKKLGPRGLMPSPKNGTVTKDVSKAIEDALKGRIDFKNDKAGVLHCLIGKVDFEFNSLLENLKAVFKAVKDSKPEGSKGKFIKEFYINTTMGSSVKVSTQSL
ncbi:MAG: large subunit ribosomal protein L1 [Rickettsiales bacterium]|jgi:large subunit ribosomal protein L1